MIDPLHFQCSFIFIFQARMRMRHTHNLIFEAKSIVEAKSYKL